SHGFGQRYDLPLPLPLFLFGAAAVVALSFVILGLFAGSVRATQRARQFDLFATALGRAIAQSSLLRAVVLSIRLAALGVFIVTVIAGFIGDQNPYRNIAPTLVWVIFWVGLVYVSALVGNLWELINPWRTLFDGAERVYRLVGGSELSLGLPYPPTVGIWPACLL